MLKATERLGCVDGAGGDLVLELDLGTGPWRRKTSDGRGSGFLLLGLS